MARLRKALLAAPLVGLSLLTGCSPSGSTAAVVDDYKVPESQVTTYAADCAASTQGAAQILTPGQARPIMVAWLVQGRIAEELAANNNFTISQADRDRLMASSGLAHSLKDHPDCMEAATNVIDLQVVIDHLGKTPGLDQASKVSVKLNPRYGNWDSSKFGPVGTGSLSSPAQGR